MYAVGVSCNRQPLDRSGNNLVSCLRLRELLLSGRRAGISARGVFLKQTIGQRWNNASCSVVTWVIPLWPSLPDSHILVTVCFAKLRRLT